MADVILFAAWERPSERRPVAWSRSSCDPTVWALPLVHWNLGPWNGRK